MLHSKEDGTKEISQKEIPKLKNQVAKPRSRSQVLQQIHKSQNQVNKPRS